MPTIYPRYSPVTVPGSQVNTPGSVSAYRLDPTTGRPYGGMPTSNPTESAPTESALEREQRLYYENLNRNQPDENAIREATRQRMQAQIDAIEREYQNITRQSEEQARGALGSTRAIQARSGLIGSDFGQAQTAKVEGQNQEIRRLNEARRSAAISEVYGAIDKEAKAEIKAKKEEALGNQRAYIEYLAGKEERGKNRVKTLAQGGVSLDELSAEQYQKLLTDSGLTDKLEFDAFFESNKPKGEQIDFKEVSLPNADGTTKVLRYGFDPVTNKPVQREYNLPIPYSAIGGQDTKVIDGRIYAKDPNTGSWKDVGGDPSKLGGGTGDGNTSVSIFDGIMQKAIDEGATTQEAALAAQAYANSTGITIPFKSLNDLVKRAQTLGKTKAPEASAGQAPAGANTYGTGVFAKIPLSERYEELKQIFPEKDQTGGNRRQLIKEGYPKEAVDSIISSGMGGVGGFIDSISSAIFR